MDFREKQAIYLQIADYVSEKIILGKWPPGERIPSVRDLGVELEVNPNTVVRTYEFLQQKGVIFNKRGVGYFVSDDASEQVTAYRREQFLETELPQLFRTMYLLNISIEELDKRFADFIIQNYKLKQSL